MKMKGRLNENFIGLNDFCFDHVVLVNGVFNQRQSRYGKWLQVKTKRQKCNNFCLVLYHNVCIEKLCGGLYNKNSGEPTRDSPLKAKI